MDERILIGVGVAVVIAGMFLAIYSGPMDLDAQTAYAMGNQDEGRSLKFRSDLFQYGGGVTGALGVILITSGWLKRVQEDSKLI